MSIDLSWWSKIPDILEDPDDILRRYVVDPQIPIHDPDPDFIPRIPHPERLYSVPMAPAGTTIIPERCPYTGDILDFIEAPIPDAGSTAQNSMSMKRAPGPPEQSTRGSAMNYPFWPGGFDEPADTIRNLEIDNFDFEHDLLTTAPGFIRGLEFKPDESQTDDGSGKNVTIDLLSIVEQETKYLALWNDDEIPSKNEINQEKARPEKMIQFSQNIDDDLLQSTTATISSKMAGGQILDISKSDTIMNVKTEWAEIIDVTQPVLDFATRIPEPAHTYPFELDTFQKQAIIKLEDHNHVFVAAHTSAGKTVVAEYAIALSQKHMTRAIYTSPIKALSNQKYRDFKQTFKDVGLITGDIQIDPTSACLIMTTEILRSMLYCGSDVTRDLEYVIFDEVHYITDSERGYVWEEVLILLPDHVSIVMLSATVPNTLEFANWVGRTKRRKVYVISTPKRPVPLKHYLYTGSGGKSSNEIFLIVDEVGRFQLKGHADAVAAKNSRKSEFQMRSDGGKHLNPKQEQNMWTGLIGYLKKNDKLPVVAFTLSRNRCDTNVEALRSCELTTSKEAGLISMFFKKCLQKLKPEDRTLPQVLTLQNSLERGIGIHHSGILPILKEIVEMLFQKGFVKLLFATETFAMGVNMPARTVIFDAATKFDGKESRMLRPAEYIQMAGRAGRRGLDDSGTVILICKKEVPPIQPLQEMMLGKPMKLISQFRLTYAMILSLLRVENVSVEDMMWHSFREFDTQSKVPENKLELQAAEKQISSLQPLSEHFQPICRFYEIAYDYIREFNYLQPYLIQSPKVIKEMKPGRILRITHKHHYYKLAIILSVAMPSNKEPTFKVLVLDDQRTSKHSDGEKSTKLIDRGDLWHRMISLTYSDHKYFPEGVGGHAVITVKPHEIVDVTKTTMKAEFSTISQNWDMRQIPRFMDADPAPSVVKAVNELSSLNSAINSGQTVIQSMSLTVGLDYAKSNILQTLENFEQIKVRLEQVMPLTRVANFQQDFSTVYDRKQLEQKMEDLSFKISNKSLSLYPDYCNKLQVLHELKYIDEQQQVAMKGRVACEMGSNELLITELILSNTLTDLDPAEIAALLSSLVFQSKTDCRPEISDSLKRSMEEIVRVDSTISQVEKKYNVGSFDETQEKERLNFGLIEVVYKWAKNKPFADIMQLTDVQEGIIVRCIQQLHETLRDVKDAARIIGNPGLQSKMEEAINTIKRDIVFAASLYTQKETVSL